MQGAAGRGLATDKEERGQLGPTGDELEEEEVRRGRGQGAGSSRAGGDEAMVGARSAHGEEEMGRTAASRTGAGGGDGAARALQG